MPKTSKTLEEIRQGFIEEGYEFCGYELLTRGERYIKIIKEDERAIWRREILLCYPNYYRKYEFISKFEMALREKEFNDAMKELSFFKRINKAYSDS